MSKLKQVIPIEVGPSVLAIKRNRPDRAIKAQARKISSETVVKSSLLEYVQGQNGTKHQVVNAIKERVEAYSKRNSSSDYKNIQRM